MIVSTRKDDRSYAAIFMINTPIRLGIVGTNFISDRLLDAASRCKDDIQVTAVYSRTEEKGAAFAQKHGIQRIYTDYEAFVSSNELDAVYIATPNICHAPQSILALQNGKHVLCEKAIAKDYASLAKMVSAAKENSCVLLEAMRPVFDPFFVFLQEELQNIGRVRRVILDYCQYSSRYDKFRAGVIENAFDPTLANAAIMDIGVYPLHVCAALFGAPRRISSMSTILENGFEGAGHVLLDFGDMKAEVSYSKIAESVTPSVIMGEDGAITFGKINAPPYIHRHLRTNGWKEEALPFAPAENNMVFELTRFAELIRVSNVSHPHLRASEITMQMIDEIRAQNNIRFS